ncbi:MAG: glycosyl transferase family 2 [Bacteroidetes bacterium MedPE-SWsnd-G2]|nr:MAG: glycosyl transferase family 2 [Bacteroidetes bacterium MedPE-SWsnd-G2]
MTILTFLFYFFVAIICIQAIYYLGVFGSFVFSKPTKSTSINKSVSVIVCCKNESKNLQDFLPSILSQNYPNFEVVLINDCSTDNTLEIMEGFASKHDNIKIVNVKSIEAFWGNKKYALTLGIKAAKHNTLLFTDADCKPVSSQWISNMSCHFSKEKTIVLGYGGYEKKKYSFLNALIRFETLLAATQYFSFAKIGMPYMGVGRNLAYRREEFFKARGFMDHMDIKSGDDDLFINQVATKSNTALCDAQKGFTVSKPETSITSWFRQKRRHVSTSKFYKQKHKFLLGLFYCSQLLFWILAIVLLANTFMLNFVLALVIFRFLVQGISMYSSAKKFGETDLILIFPFLELFLILSQFSIFITNKVSKPNHWK